MNLKERLEEGQSKTLTMDIVTYVGAYEKRFGELMKLVLGSDVILSQRAAWPFSYIGIEHPKLLKSYFGQLVKKLEDPKNHAAINRNILRVFQEVEVPEKYWGKLIDLCFKFILRESEPIATRAFSISVAVRICKHFPDLKNEFLLILNDLRERPHAPAITVRIKYALKELNRLEPKI